MTKLADAASPTGLAVRSELHLLWHALWSQATHSPPLFALVLVVVSIAAIKAVRATRWAFVPRDRRRRFTRAEKAVILRRASGRCEHHGWLFGRCRQTQRLEADHIHPHSRGGQTALDNGQALCHFHNRLKLARVPFTFELRRLERQRAGYFPQGHSFAIVRARPPSRRRG